MVLMMVMVGCTPPGPLLKGEGTSPDSPAAARHPLAKTALPRFSEGRLEWGNWGPMQAVERSDQREVAVAR